MDFDQELQRVAESYADQGYAVVIRPGEEDLPPFAKPFKLDLIGRRGRGGVLVQVKKDRGNLAADPDSPRIAEVTGAQPSWRFDLVILQAEPPMARKLRGAREPSEEQINQIMASAENLVRGGYLNSALLTAWSGFEAAMRRRLRAEGETVGWESEPEEMLSWLVTSGIAPRSEFSDLGLAYRQRNEIAHGFAALSVDPDTVRFLLDLSRRFLEESKAAAQPA
jgi:hypothetical protein